MHIEKRKPVKLKNKTDSIFTKEYVTYVLKVKQKWYIIFTKRKV